MMMLLLLLMMMMMQMSWELNATSSASLLRSWTRPSPSWPASRRASEPLHGTAADKDEEEQEDDVDNVDGAASDAAFLLPAT